MDPIEPGKGQEEPAEHLRLSSRGRQRKKNPKYSDYETADALQEQETQTKSSRGGRGAAKSPARNGTRHTEGGEEAGGETSEETPKKTAMAKKTPTKETPARKTPARRTPARKTPARKTPAKKTPAKKTPAKPSPPADGGPPAEEGGVVDGVQRENGTQKPKYVRKRPAEDPVPEPQTLVEPEEEEEEMAPGGRRRRGAAKVALKYLHILAKEVLSHPDDESGSKRGGNGAAAGRTGSKASQKARKGKGRKRKRRFSDSDSADDEDFIPDVDEVEEEEEEEGEGTEVEEESENSDTDSAGGSPAVHVNRSHGPNIKTPNGLNTKTMRSVWDSAKTTRKFREQHHSSWVFPEWIPSSSAWKLVPHSDLESYLPQELQSAAFSVSREGLHEDETPLQRLGRFAAAPAHPDRWDMFLNAGGPVWAVEWCPTPDGASASQYIALACHRGMEDQHHLNQTYSGAGLVQLWGLGSLEYNTRPDSPPALAYGLAQDRGFIWHLKWCPAGGWELPSCGRKAPFLPRLGLLAVAASSGVVTIYSLPHPDALHSSQQQANPGEANEQLPIYQAEGVLTLKLGSIKAPRHQSSGQVLSMDWLPEKPHNIMAIGFYDGVVGLWDLATKSALLRVREFESLSLLPYRCLLAHDNAVRALAFCPASRYLLVTAGEDRYVKTWDLRRPYDPITVQKRYLTTEIYWPLNAPGLLLAQENAYAVFGSQGVHYFDHHLRPIFVVPRTGTLWSISYTEWLNSVVTADSLGEVMFSILPHFGLTPQYIKRTLERRFPVYFTSLVPHDATKDQEMGGVEGEGEQGGGPDAASEGGNESDDENGGGGGGGGGKDECPPLLIPTYKEAVKRYCLHHTDADMRTFTGSDKRACWKRMRDTELKAKLNMDEMPLAALHKVRFNPNMCCHTWVVSGGRTGLVRLNCLRAMISTQAKKIISENQDQFDALYSPKDQEEDVQTPKDEL